MINLQNIEGYSIADPGFELLREVAQKYCPEELQAARKEVVPDEVLNLAASLRRRNCATCTTRRPTR